MYIQKLANAAASKITVTATATNLYDLLDTAASTANDLPGSLNAVDLVVEDGDIRMLLDGNTPTAANGILLSSGCVYSFRGIPLTKMQLIRVSSDVAVSVQVGLSKEGEGSSAAAYAVTLEAGSVTVGDVGITELGGQNLPIDDAAMALNPVFAPIGGEYRAADTTYTDGDATILQTDVNGYVKGVDKAYDSSTQSNKVAEVSPLNQAYVGEVPIDETNIAQSTTDYGYLDISGYKTIGIQGVTSGAAPTDVLTCTIEGTLQDDGTAAASCTYVDVTTWAFDSATGARGTASWVDTDFMAIMDVAPFKYVRVKYTTSAGGGNDADLTVFTKKLY